MTRSLTDTLDAACRKVAPLWPLSRFVAVNPYLGLSHLDPASADTALRRASGEGLTLPRDNYAAAFASGSLTRADLEEAVAAAGPDVPFEVKDLLGALREGNDAGEPGRLERGPFLDDLAREIARFEGHQPTVIADQQFGPAIGQDVRDLAALEQRVDGHMDEPGPRRRKRHQAGQPTLRRPASHPRSLLDTPRQPARQPRDVALELGIAQHAIAQPQGRRVGLAHQCEVVERARWR